MTTRKDRSRVPKGARLSAEDNQWFETVALTDLENLPTRAWEDMVALWIGLPLAHPATRRRILARCIQLASKRGDPLPVRVAEYVIRELASQAPRASIHDEDGLCKAARHLARNPRASLSELAAAAGSKKTTVRLWKARQDFQAHLNDEKCLVELEQKRLASLDRARREHEQRGRTVRRSKKRAPKKVLLNG